MRKRGKRPENMKYYPIFSATFRGASVILLLLMLFSYAGSKTDLPSWLIPFMLLVSVCSGGFVSGRRYGRIKRHGGLKKGAFCGFVLYLLLFLTGILWLGKLPPVHFVKYLIFLCISGALGGVNGVNSRIKKPPL